MRVVSAAFTLRNASTSTASLGISALGWSQAGGGLVVKMDQRLLLAETCANISGIHGVSSRGDHFQLIVANLDFEKGRKFKKKIQIKL